MHNVAVHLKNAKSSEVKARQRTYHLLSVPLQYSLQLLPPVSVFAAVDQEIADRIAKAIGVPTVKPLQVKPADSAVRFKFRAV